MKALLIRAAVLLLIPFVAATSRAQITVSPTLPRHAPAIDTAKTAARSADSMRVLDSLDQRRRAALRGQTAEWSQRGIAEDTWDLSLLVSTFGRIKAGDLVEYFSETVGRENPQSDRTQLAGLDRYFELSVTRKFEEGFGIGAAYNFMARYNKTIVDAGGPLPTGERDLNITYHLLALRTLLPIYSAGGARFSLSGGFGPVIAFLTERDASTSANLKRHASNVGIGIAFDAIGNFEVFSHVRFTLDIYARNTITGEFKDGAGAPLSKPFGSRTKQTSASPTGKSSLFGIAIGATISL